MTQIEQRLQKLADRQVPAIGNAILALRSGDGRIDARAAAGRADAGGTLPMTPDTPYLLASIAKMYTAVVVMKLVESGDLDLEVPAVSYLGSELISGIHVMGGTDFSDRITVGQLVNQTSGLADYFDGKPQGGVSLLSELVQGHDRALTIEDIVAIVRRLSPGFAPGTPAKAQYSDTNYALLGAIISAVTGSTVAENFQKSIYDPLGLINTYAVDPTRDQPTPAAVFLKGETVEIPLFLSSHTAEGGLVSTVSENLRFLQAFFGRELLSAAQLAMMTEHFNRIFYPLRYGSGIMLFKLPRWMTLFRETALMGHSGSTGSFAFYDRRRDLYVAGTLNQLDNPARPYRLMTRMVQLAV